MGWRLAAWMLALAIAGAGCGGPASEPAADDPGLLHVHGLGVDPADGRLFAATHTGLFVIEDGVARRIGPMHDLMGFTVAGPGDLLASGHPDLRDESLQLPGKPPLLGLVHSDDGERWESLSLLGDADFHALDAAHGAVYGWFNGEFMVSRDRETWETLSRINLVDFAVSPDDAELVVGLTGPGVARSQDGGANWEQISREPLALLSWSDDGLHAVTADGAVMVSRDAGESWERTGAAEGAPEAMLAVDGTLYLAVAGEGVLESSDGGRTWRKLAERGQPHGG